MVAASGLTIVVLALLFGPELTSSTGFLPSVITIVLAACGMGLAELAMAILFLVGFYQLHAGRYEYGTAHERSMERSIVFLILVVAAVVLGNAYTTVSAASGSAAELIPGVSLVGSANLIFGPVTALFAGLALFYAIRALAEPPERARLRTAIALGLIGSVAGPVILFIVGARHTSDVSLVVSAVIASALAGQGTAAISLLLFALVLFQVRRDLLAGRPAPVLPRYEQVFPWAYAPYGYPPSWPPTPPQR